MRIRMPSMILISRATSFLALTSLALAGCGSNNTSNARPDAAAGATHDAATLEASRPGEGGQPADVASKDTSAESGQPADVASKDTNASEASGPGDSGLGLDVGSKDSSTSETVAPGVDAQADASLQDGATADVALPAVLATNPANNATGVAVGTTITATFSEAMTASTMNTVTFSLDNGVIGSVTYSGTTATFTPSNHLASSTTYTATITTGAEDLAGRGMAANYTWTFTTAAPVVQTIDPGTPSPSSPRIAVDPSGNVMAVWMQSDGNAQSIYANKYTAGAGWGTATLLETSDMPASSPQIVADSMGNFLAVWAQAWKTVNGERDGIYANRYVAGTGWGTAVTVYADTTNGDVSANPPQIAADPNGNAVAVWSVYDWSWNHDSVRASRYVAGTGWSTVSNLSTEAVRSATGPQVAVDPSGNAIVVWSQASDSNNSVQGVQALRYASGTGWETTPVLIESAAVASANSGVGAQIGFDPRGNAIAVWQQPGQPGIYANRYVVGTGWGIPATLADPGTTSYDVGVQLAVDKNGNAVAVWNQNGGVLYANRYVAGVGWGTTVIADLGTSDSSPGIALETTGNAVAVWAQFSRNQDNIWATRYSVATGWAAVLPWPGSIVNATLDGAGAPQIVIDGSGNATVVWVQNRRIYARNGL